MRTSGIKGLVDTLGMLGVTMQDEIITHVTPCEAFKAFKTYALIIISLAGIIFLFTWGVMTGVGGLLWNKIEILDNRGIENKTNIATLTIKLDERFNSFESKLNNLQQGQTEMKVVLQEYMRSSRSKPADQ